MAMLSGLKLLISVGCFISFYGSGNCLVSPYCEDVKCEITNNGLFRLCTLDTNPGAWLSEATPIGETRSMACKEGTTYGRGGGKLWVTNDCHGEFRVCSSTISRYGVGKCFTPLKCDGEITTECPAGPKYKTFITVAEIREQPDSSNCTSDTYSRNGNSIYVDKTCDAMFTVCYANEYDVAYTTKRCEGSCEIDHAGLIVSLDISHVYKGQGECSQVKLRNDATNIIYMGGCDADITVGYIPVKYEIICTSQQNKTTTCNDKKSIPAIMSFQRELSEERCFLGSTYGFNTEKNGTPEVWVSEGCDAVFEAFPRVDEQDDFKELVKSVKFLIG